MSEYIYKIDFQEIIIDKITQIYEIEREYCNFYHLPRQGRGDVENDSTYMQAFFRGQSDVSWKIEPSICRNRAIGEETPEKGQIIVGCIRRMLQSGNVQ